jgi:cytochrome bd-type quinol oxidase subunit 2
MEAFTNDPTLLAVLAFIAAHSLILLVGGTRQQRQQPDLIACSRIGMGAGTLLATAAVVALLAFFSASAPFSPLTPLIILLITFLLQGYVFGMCCGLVLGLLVGLSRFSKAQTQATLAPPAVKLADYRVAQVAVLPAALLVVDVAVVGGFDLLFLRRFTQVELWNLAVFPGLLLAICLLCEWFIRQLARLPMPSSLAQDERAANQVRARLVGLLLEREIFALFLLALCQWVLQTFSQAHPSDLLYTGALPVLAVVLISLRGLLDRAQQALHQPPAKQSTRAQPPRPDSEREAFDS